MVRDIKTLVELSGALAASGAPSAQLALLGQVRDRAEDAIRAVVRSIPRPERDWEDIARLVDIADPGVARGLYDQDGWRS
ncbi:MAG: hypothetical protein LBE08_03685 [Bifidobacteriaceae bacterium]|nr:hypothetical protein [Bifidobacteriaceae bacterium]